MGTTKFIRQNVAAFAVVFFFLTKDVDASGRLDKLGSPTTSTGRICEHAKMIRFRDDVPLEPGHCYHCGRIICKPFCSKVTTFTVSYKEERVCVPCYNKALEAAPKRKFVSYSQHFSQGELAEMAEQQRRDAEDSDPYGDRRRLKTSDPRVHFTYLIDAIEAENRANGY